MSEKAKEMDGIREAIEDVLLDDELLNLTHLSASGLAEKVVQRVQSVSAPTRDQKTHGDRGQVP